MKYKFEKDMLNGVLLSKILFFAIPLAGSSILQQLFNAADIAVVGHFAGSKALAAVGANAPVINMLLNLFIGLSIGSNVIIAILTGKKDNENVQKAVHTSILLAVISGFLLTFIGCFFAKDILTAISTPNDILDLAVLYLQIFFIGMPFIMLYNFGAAILRCKGDTERPLIALFVSGIINVILNLVFVICFNMSVDGVATATVISNAVCSCMIVYFLVKEEGNLKLSFNKLNIDKKSLIDIAKIGIPAGLQGMVFSVSNVCIQSALNLLGSEVIASTAIALNFEYIAYFVFNAFAQACVTFVGQNYGAGKIKRCRRVVGSCMFLGLVSTTTVCILFIIFADKLCSIFTDNSFVIGLAVFRLEIILCLEFLNIISEILSGGMRGFGYSLSPAVICVLGICGVRILWVYTIFQSHKTYGVLLSVYPISWLVALLPIIVMYFITVKNVEKNNNLIQRTT